MIKIVQMGNVNLLPQYYYLDKEKLKLRQEDFYNNFVKTVDYAKDEQADFFVVIGNLFDTPKPDSYTVSKVIKLFSQLTVMGCKIILVPGPNDVSKDDSLNALEAFNDIDGIKCFSNYDYSKMEFSKNGIKLNFISKNFEHRNYSCDFDSNLVDSKSFNIFMKNHNLDTDIELSKFDLVFSIFKDDVKNSLFCPGIERISFDECGENKGFHLISIDKENKVNIEFIELSCREMEKIDIEMNLSTSSIENEINKKIKRGKKSKIIKLVLKGKVLFEIYKNYSRKTIEDILKDRFFYYVIENEIQIEDLEFDKFEDIRIFPVEKEFSLLVDEKIDFYKKKKDNDYSKFYKNVRSIGINYLKSVYRKEV